MLTRVIADARSFARWLGVLFSAASVLFAISVYCGFWDWWRGDNLVAEVAARFDKSYAANASWPVKPGDKEWVPLIRIIEKYSHADLPKDKQPRVFARMRALTAAKDDATGAEWTAPTTPTMLLYKDWPGHGDVPSEDSRIVGTIEDLHNWIRTDKADFDYLVRTIIFGLLSVCVGTFLALPEKSKAEYIASRT